MDKATECVRLAKQLGWSVISSLDGLQELGVPDAVLGDCVWIPPDSYLGITSGRVSKGKRVRWVRGLDFDPWIDANDDLLVLELMQGMSDSTWSDYKDALYHETKGHGTHNVWEYKKGKFANAAIMLANKLGWR